MKKVKFKVVSAIDNGKAGDMLDAYLVKGGIDEDIVILPPSDKFQVYCLIVCMKFDDYYIEKSPTAWTNITNSFAKQLLK